MRAVVVVVVVVAASALGGTGCAFEACCMRPTTGLYDVCIAAAAPPALGPSDTPRPEVPPPPARVPGTAR